MLNADMRTYDYFTLGEEDAYGQAQISDIPKGKVKMAIYTSSQGIQDNINYTGCQYIGLTNTRINDSYVIDYEGKRLKVLYITPKSRYIYQVFMAEV